MHFGRHFQGFSLAIVAALSLCAGAIGQQYSATINSTAILRAAPSSQSTQVGTLQTGTVVDVQICFDRGAYCAVAAGGTSGFVSGDLLTDMTSGTTVAAEEAKRWQELDSQPALSALAGAPADVVAWGDSLTAGAGGGPGNSYPDQAAALLPGRLIENEGIGGQSTTAIAARMNAIPTKLTFANNQIATGPTPVVDRSVTPITNQGPNKFAGSVCGIHGSLQATTSDNGQTYDYVFTPDMGTTATACPAGSDFTFDIAEKTRSRTAWLWLGRNGAQSGHTIEGDIAAAVASLGHNRFIVGSILPSADDGAGGLAGWQRINAALKSTYGDRYVDVVSALQAASDGSAEDQADIAAGILPRSLRSDAIHLNKAGYAVVARVFAEATQRLGF